jgi:NAD(P)-dependent dehydrogenase (short-subunit alcohol dehydrogenase family)
MVIGAAGTLGKAMSAAIIEQGAFLIAVDNSEEALDELKSVLSNKDRASFFTADITNVESIQEVIKQSVSLHGALDGAVNTAYPRNKNYGRDFFNVTYEDFSENLSLHLGGYFLFMQQCAKYVVDTGNSFSLVNISSIYGVIPPRFDIYENTAMTMPVEYAAIKSALIHLSKFTSTYMKNTRFRVNSVSPGGILAAQPDSFVEAYQKYSRVKGMLDAKDVVGTIMFLLSDDSEYMCGQNLVVDDGFSL